MTQEQLDAFSVLAERLANVAAPEVMVRFRTGLLAESKADSSPVTEADRAAEAALRALIEAEQPDHGIVGEEYGSDRADAEYVWVLDPIDGTKSFVTGKPTFGILVALLHRGRPVIGVIDHPALGDRWVGVAGRPTTFNGRPIATRPCAALDQAWMYATSPTMFRPGPEREAYGRLSGAVRQALYGCDCYAYGLLSCGTVDLVCEATLMPYDYLALVPVIEGAGGIITDWSGQPLGLEGDGTALAAGDRALHQAALARLKDES
ncbi:MAG: histidinol-phosphatase [Rhodobacterales bacterium]|nr:histidinol-phosphatase [Rhodobacterales bacterium]